MTSIETYPSVRHLENTSEAEIDRAVYVLQEAFRDDPFTEVLLEGNLSLDKYLLGTNIRAALLSGKVHVAQVGPEISDIAGVAIWYPPGKSGMATEEERESSNWNKFLAMLSEKQRTWWMSYFIPSMARLSEEGLGPNYTLNSWHLHIFGVAPEYQGKGLGKMLFNHVDDIAASEGKSIVLETTTDVDVAIYKRLGCEVCHEIKVEHEIKETRVRLMVKRHGDS